MSFLSSHAYLAEFLKWREILTLKACRIIRRNKNRRTSLFHICHMHERVYESLRKICKYQQNVPQHSYLFDTLGYLHISLPSLKFTIFSNLSSLMSLYLSLQVKFNCCGTKVASDQQHNCCGASVASEQHYKQDLKRIYRRGFEFSHSSLFTGMHCI